MGLALEEPRERDRRVEADGVRLWVQTEVDSYYSGAELDWDDSEGGFAFRHPRYGNC